MLFWDTMQLCLMTSVVIRWLRLRRAGLALLISLGLTGCGGGDDGAAAGSGAGTGAGTGTGASTATPQRVARLRYDFDANGVVEGELVVTYDAVGRVATETYTYTDDGTPDTVFGSFSIGAAQQNFANTYRYDANDRLQQLVMVEAGNTITSTYGRDAEGWVTALDMAFADSSLPYSLVFTVTPSGALPTQVLMQITAAGTTQDVQRHDLAYDAAGRVSTDTTTTLSTGSSTALAYTWDASGHAQTITQTDGNGATVSTVTLERDASNRPLSRLTTQAMGSPYRWRWDYTALTWTIDLGDNGSTEAIVHTVLESGPCLPTVMWQPGAEPNAPASDTLPVIPGAGYAVLPYCVAG